MNVRDGECFSSISHTYTCTHNGYTTFVYRFFHGGLLLGNQGKYQINLGYGLDQLHCELTHSLGHVQNF